MIKLRKPQVVYCLHYLCVRRMFQGGGSSFMSKWTFHERHMIIISIIINRSVFHPLVCWCVFHPLVCVFTTWSVFQVVASWARALWKTCASVAAASATHLDQSEILAMRHTLLVAPVVAVLLWSVVVVVSIVCVWWWCCC